MINKIHFTVANHTSPSGKKELVPRLKSGTTEEFMDLYGDGKVFSAGTMLGTLYTMRDLLVEMMGTGTPIHLPALGTFTLTLSGTVEVQNGKYVGHGVHVDGIRFTPDEELLADLRRMEVAQTPLPVRHYADEHELEAALAALFARKDSITRRDLSHALGGILSPHRLSDLLARLVAEGRLRRQGSGNQTRYREG